MKLAEHTKDYASIATLWEDWTGLPLRDSDSDGGTGVQAGRLPLRSVG